MHPLQVQKLLGRAKQHNFYRTFPSVFKIPFTQCAYLACTHSLKARRKHPPGLLESFGLHCSGQMSSSLTMPTQTWGWLQPQLLLGTEVGAPPPECRGLAQLQSPWQVLCLTCLMILGVPHPVLLQDTNSL